MTKVFVNMGLKCFVIRSLVYNRNVWQGVLGLQPALFSITQVTKIMEAKTDKTGNVWGEAAGGVQQLNF